MSIDDDIRAVSVERATEAARSHERAMRKTTLKKARIEARRDVKIARVNNDDWKLFVFCTALAVCLTVLISFWVYMENTDDPPAEVRLREMELKHEKYVQCVEAEGDWNTNREDCDF